MTDVRAILESQAAQRARYGKLFQYGSAVLVALSILVAAAVYGSGKRPDFGLLMFPLLFVGCAAAYSPKHVRALREAIADPDPALDPHFAECLVSEREEIAKLGREAFLQRFEQRLPQLDAAGWEYVGWGLKNAPVDDAERLLRLLAQGAPASAIERVEDLVKRTKVDRLRTLGHSTLGDIRLRVARDRILDRVHAVHQAQDSEVQRLGI